MLKKFLFLTKAHKFLEEKGENIAIEASIITNKESQKGMLIGKSGSMIKKIKTQSIKLIKNIFPNKYIDLELKVEVKKDWKKDKRILEKIGLK